MLNLLSGVVVVPCGGNLEVRAGSRQRAMILVWLGNLGRGGGW